MAFLGFGMVMTSTPDVSRCTSTLLSSSLCLIVLQSCFLSNIDPKLSVKGAGGFIIQSFEKSESLEPWVLRVRALLILDSICFRLSSKLCLACLKKSSLVLSILSFSSWIPSISESFISGRWKSWKSCGSIHCLGNKGQLLSIVAKVLLPSANDLISRHSEFISSHPVRKNGSSKNASLRLTGTVVSGILFAKYFLLLLLSQLALFSPC